MLNIPNGGAKWINTPSDFQITSLLAGFLGQMRLSQWNLRPFPVVVLFSLPLHLYIYHGVIVSQISGQLASQEFAYLTE